MFRRWISWVTKLSDKGSSSPWLMSYIPQMTSTGKRCQRFISHTWKYKTRTTIKSVFSKTAKDRHNYSLSVFFFLRSNMKAKRLTQEFKSTIALIVVLRFKKQLQKSVNLKAYKQWLLRKKKWNIRWKLDFPRTTVYDKDGRHTTVKQLIL